LRVKRHSHYARSPRGHGAYEKALSYGLGFRLSVHPSVCLSVCLSVCHTLRLYQNGAS